MSDEALEPALQSLSSMWDDVVREFGAAVGLQGRLSTESIAAPIDLTAAWSSTKRLARRTSKRTNSYTTRWVLTLRSEQVIQRMGSTSFDVKVALNFRRSWRVQSLVDETLRDRR